MEELRSFKHEGETYYYKLDTGMLECVYHPDIDMPILANIFAGFGFLTPHFFDQFPDGMMTTAEDVANLMLSDTSSAFTTKRFNDLFSFARAAFGTLNVNTSLGKGEQLEELIENHDLESLKLFNVDRGTPATHFFHSDCGTQEPVLFTSSIKPPTNVNYIKVSGGLAFNNEGNLICNVVYQRDLDTLTNSETEYEEGPDYFFKVMNYTFKPDPVFFSLPKENPKFYLGMEVEVNTQVPEKELQEIVTKCHPVQEPFFYFKADSSITGDMSYVYEIVTHPMSPRRMKKEWRTLFNKLEKLCADKNGTIGDYFNWGARLGNGIHIHISNTAFQRTGKPVDRYCANLYKNRFLTAMNQWDTPFQQWMKKITKRPRTGVQSEYYPPHPEFDGKTLARRLKQGQMYGEHRSACHSGAQTTEVRVFYGLFQLDHINTCIEFTLAMLEFTAYASYKSFSRRFVNDFTQFVYKQQGYRALKGVLKSCA